jgi:hypothetical protein
MTKTHLHNLFPQSSPT